MSLPPRSGARAIGLGADRVLICADAITEEAYVTALAASLGAAYDPLDRVARADCPLDDDQLIQAAATGLLPVREGSKTVYVVAPRFLAARRLAAVRQSRPEALRSFRLRSSACLSRFVAATPSERLAGMRLTGCASLGRFSPMRRARIAWPASSLSW
jgi:hypothetical protein